jgi:predicted transcriptional regulator
MVLTVNGSAAIVVQDATTYQQLLDRVGELEERERFIAAVNEGLADVAAGRVVRARDVLKYRGR